MVHEAQGQLVQKVATGGLPAPPSRYVLREKDRPIGGGEAPELGFPTVDVQRLAEPGDVEEAAKIQAALQSWGLFAVTGHGIPESLLDDIRSAAREFFHLPSSEKLQYANQTEAGEFQNEGYGIDRVDTADQILDWCDRLYLTVQPEESRQLRLWPRHPPSLAKLLHEYALQSEQVAKQVLRAMARTLGFDEEFFLGRHVGEKVASYARFTYYPPWPLPAPRPRARPEAPHRQLRDHHAPPGPRRRRAPGAQGRRPVGGRARARPRRRDAGGRRRRDGDHESNAAFRAPTHRVVAGDRERMSLATFYQPEPHRDLEPAAELVGGDRPAMYRRVGVKTFADGFWDAFARGEHTIDFLNARVDNSEAPRAVPGT